MNKILVEVSVGELLDKISILEIKKDRIKDSNKLKFINEEYEVLKNELEKNIKIDEKLAKFFTALKNVNSKLWIIEDEKRKCEKESDFEENFGLNPENKTDQDVENAFDYTSDICYDLDRIGIIGADTLADMLGQIGTLSDEYDRCKRT